MSPPIIAGTIMPSALIIDLLRTTGAAREDGFHHRPQNTSTRFATGSSQ
jgi:hypothetical protein